MLEKGKGEEQREGREQDSGPRDSTELCKFKAEFLADRLALSLFYSTSDLFQLFHRDCPDNSVTPK